MMAVAVCFALCLLIETFVDPVASELYRAAVTNWSTLDESIKRLLHDARISRETAERFVSSVDRL